MSLAFGLAPLIRQCSFPRWTVFRQGLSLLTFGTAAWISLWSYRHIRRLRRPRTVKVESLSIFPVKACRGHKVNRVILTKLGFKDDRRYMIVNADGVFVSQRELPAMARIFPDIPTADGITLRMCESGSTGSNSDVIFVPVVSRGPTRKVRVWDDDVSAFDQGDKAAAWLEAALGKPGLRFVLFDRAAHRSINPSFGQGGTAFADGFPVLLTTQASLDDLRRQLPSESVVGVDNFRPNIHVSGCGPWDEDEIRSLSFGSGATLRLVKPCARCTVPTVDPLAGVRYGTGEPLKTLRRIRNDVVLRRVARLHQKFLCTPEAAGGSFFGQNALVEFPSPAGFFEIAVGDTAVVEWS